METDKSAGGPTIEPVTFAELFAAFESVLVLVTERWLHTRYVAPFFATGFLGAFTTFSTFAVETDVLVKDGHAAIAGAYVVASVAAGVAAAVAGIRVARAV